MLYRFEEELRGAAIQAIDDSIGRVSDFHFDDRHWVVRYLVVDTGDWLPGRLVVISPASVDRFDRSDRVVHVSLSREQIEDSPSISVSDPLLAEQEAALAGYYGWPLYWGGFSPLVTTGLPDYPAVPVTGDDDQPVVTDNVPAMDEGSEPVQRDPHLRSFNEVQGYAVNANDGKVGSIHDLLFDDQTGRVMYMVVDTGNLFTGRKVLLAPSWVQAISWMDEEVDVDLKVETVKASPEYDPAVPIREEDEDRLYRHYGKDRK